MKLKNFVLAAIACLAVVICADSCTKKVIASYGWDLEEIGELKCDTEETATAFVNALNGVMNQYSGTEFDVSQLVASVRNAIAPFSGKIEGTFHLYRVDVTPREQVATFTL